MDSLLHHLRRFDWLLIGAISVLLLLGLTTLFSLSSVSVAPFFNRQLWWVVVGLLGLWAASLVDFRLFRTQGLIVFLLYLFIVLLLAVLLLVQFKIRGVEGWLRVGGFSLQPVEPAKLMLVILLAKFFSKRHIEIYRIRHLLVSGLYVAIPAALVLLQPDLGSVVILATIWLAIVLFSGMKARHLIILLMLTTLVFFGAWNWGLRPYQKARITGFLNPYADPKGAGYQMIQSMIAVGSGKFWGKGLGYGSQSHLNFLPEAETDFIFAAFAEEWGFVGVVGILVLFFILLWRVVRIATRASNNFSRLYALGFAALIFSQAFIHMGMNMGLLPITGLTLPFVSYGGSSLITLLVGIGILQNIQMNAQQEIE